MAYSYVRYTGNGSQVNYTFPFPYLSQSDVKVYLNGTETTAFTFLNANTVQFSSAPDNGVSIEIRRVTPKDSPIVDFTDGSVLLERDLDLLSKYSLYIAQEDKDSLDVLYDDYFTPAVTAAQTAAAQAAASAVQAEAT